MKPSLRRMSLAAAGRAAALPAWRLHRMKPSLRHMAVVPAAAVVARGLVPDGWSSTSWRCTNRARSTQSRVTLSVLRPRHTVREPAPLCQRSAQSARADAGIPCASRRAPLACRRTRAIPSSHREGGAQRDTPPRAAVPHRGALHFLRGTGGKKTLAHIVGVRLPKSSANSVAEDFCKVDNSLF